MPSAMFDQWGCPFPINNSICETARFVCKYDGMLTRDDIGEIYRQTRHVATVLYENGTKYVFVQSDRGGQLKNAIDLAEQNMRKCPTSPEAR